MLRAFRDNWALLIVAGALCAFAAVAFLGTTQQQARAAERVEVESAAQTLAVTLDHADLSIASAALASATRMGYSGAWLLDANGRVLQQRGVAFSGTSWRSVFDGSNTFTRLSWEGVSYWVATAQSPTGERVVLARPIGAGLGLAFVLRSAGFGLGAWLLLAIVVAVQARHRRADPALMAVAERLANRPSDTRAHTEALEDFGDRATPLLYMAEQLSAANEEREEAKAYGNAFLQVGSHYTLVCSLDGRLLDANPAFLARTGLDPAALRGRSVHELGDTLPFDRLLALAQRSLAERTTLSGIPCTLTLGDESRPVDVSLRAVPRQHGAAVLMVLGDRHREYQLEHQIDQFTDSIDLMVDQRVAQLTAGRAALDAVLEDAGVALLIFDRAGATEALNSRAEELTGRTRFTLRQFGQAASLLCPELSRREVFQDWFWQGKRRPFPLATHTAHGMRSLLWLTGCERRGGEVVRRALVGIPAVSLGETGDPVHRIGTLAAALDPHRLPLEARPYVEVIREAVRRLDELGTPSGDGVPSMHPHVPS